MNLELGKRHDVKPDEASAMRTADMGPRLLEYVENIYKQVYEIYERLGIASCDDLAALPSDQLLTSAPDIERLMQLFDVLQQVFAERKSVERALRSTENAARYVAAAEEVAKKYPTDASLQLWLQLGKADVDMVLGNDPHGALAAAQGVAERQPVTRRGFMLGSVAKAYLRAGDFDEAADIAARAGDTSSEEYIDALVAAYIANDRLDDALGYAVGILGTGKRRPMPARIAGDLYAKLYVAGRREDIQAALMPHQENAYTVQRHAVRKLVDADKLDAALQLAREVGVGYAGLECLQMVGIGMRRKKMDTTDVGDEMFFHVRVEHKAQAVRDTAEEWVKLHKGKRPSTLTYGCTALSFMAKGGPTVPAYIEDLAEMARANTTKTECVIRVGEVTRTIAKFHGTEVALPYVQEMEAIRREFVGDDDAASLSATDMPYAATLVACGRVRDAEHIAEGDLVDTKTRCNIYLDIVRHTDPENEKEVRRLLAAAEKVVREAWGGLSDEQTLGNLGEAHAFVDDIPGVLRYVARVHELDAKSDLMSYVVHSAKDAHAAKRYLEDFRAMILDAKVAGADVDTVLCGTEKYMQWSVDKGLPDLLMEELERRVNDFAPSEVLNMLFHHAVVKYREAKKHMPAYASE